jgi:hypothetical protein
VRWAWTANVTGAMACSAALRSVAFVRQLFISCMQADPISFQAAGPPGVPAWSTPRPSSASNIYKTGALLSRVGAKDIMPIVAFMAALLSLAMLGSCRYVELAVSRKWTRLTRCSDRKPRESPHTLRYPWGHYGRLPYVLVLPFLFAHPGAPRNRVGGEEF